MHCIQIRFVSTEENYSHRLACILLGIGIIVETQKLVGV